MSDASDGAPEEGRAAWRSRVVLLLLAGVLCLVNLPIFFGQVVHHRDPAQWSYPVRSFIRHAWQTGQSAAWNPYQGLGFASYADPLYGLHYPPNLLFLLGPLPETITWMALLHLVWGGAGMLLLGRRLGMSPVAALVAALAWTLGGYSTSAWTAGILIVAAAWLPWCGVGFVRAVHIARRPYGAIDGALGIALPLAMSLLVGELFMSIMAAGFGLALAVAVRLATDRAVLDPDATVYGGVAVPRRVNRRIAVAVAFGLALGVLGGSVSFLPAAAQAGETQRAQPLERSIAERCSLSPRRLYELVAPGAFGHPYAGYPGFSWLREECVSDTPLLFSIYIGGSVVALASLAFGRRRRLAPIVAGLMAAALVLALGRHTPLHDLTRRLVRPLAYMRYPEKYMVLVSGFACVLAGLGVQRWLEDAPRLRWPWRTAALGAGLLALAVLAPRFFPASFSHLLRGGALQSAAAALAICAAQLLSRRNHQLGSALIVLAVSADLAAAYWPLQEYVSPKVVTERPPAADVLLRTAGTRLSPPRLYRHRLVDASVRRFVVARSSSEMERRYILTLSENQMNALGVASLPGYDAAVPTALLDMWAAARDRGQDVMRLLSIDFALMPVEDPSRASSPALLTPVADPLPGARLYRVEDRLPRVFLAGKGVLAADDVTVQSALRPEVVAGVEVLLSPGPGARELPGPLERPGLCRVDTYRNTRVEATCDARRPALAVFVEQWSPGWRATVDGVEQPVLRANHCMRAVHLQPGSHHIVLQFHPAGLTLGRLLSTAAGAAMLLCLLVLHFVRRRTAKLPAAT